MHTDKDLTAADILALANRDGVASFFAALGYRTDPRLPQTPATLGITAESLQKQVKYIERAAFQENGAETLDVYLIELAYVTVANTQGLARTLRNRSGNYLLVLTDDYERLDFVLIERSLPVPSSTGMLVRQVMVRPRILTVNRRNPTVVQLRVLRRFSCTETDSDAQYDKLLSAYTVADWSEPLFNNRALFSDYYLNERLRERPEWRERPESAYHSLRELLTNPRERLRGYANTRQLLLEPAFEALGFRVTPPKRAGDRSGPDYALFSARSPDKPIAFCLAYTWNRYLDGRDETRDADRPDENPGAMVVSLLEEGEAPWGIVTNGKVWRLYSAKAHSRATNYYEIDLEETLAMADPNEAFRYFWLLFRADAFVPRDILRDGQTAPLSFLDELREESESYARAMGERLKGRVFEDIFPHFVEGFIEHLRSQPPITGFQQGTLLPVAQQLALKQEPDDSFRRQVFQGTLTFLYRLLFLLYAESRGLLPVKEVRGYWENSLTRIKQEIADKAGSIEDEAPDKLRKAYRSDSADLYDRILRLFTVIDKGSRELNVPLYDGGLFLTAPDPSDHTPEADNARFLLEHKVPDRFLALGLDRLARDIDQKRQDLVFIDYKSLGVRQLGSIYEGLLEFRVRIASEKMAVVQGKKTEEVIPHHEALKTGRKVLTRGRGRAAEERVYRPGEVYLENDRQERKATGSYYTPDHIVKYIVEQAVGPVLDGKLEKLRPGFREAQQAYRNAVRRAEAFRKQGMKPDDPAKTVNSRRQLVDDLFDVRVLDPAMGSGHFLVEAVDFICDRILGQREGFLQAFPWNPVTAFLQETRQAILTDMERQGVTTDTSRLTDINLLKRHVLKRCVYGVDLNPMAVELAKVSLWLDCFTLGAPLSFLDHHLKCGNSLIGATVQEVEAELAEQKKGHVGDLFGGPFQGLLNSTFTMLEIARSPDATVEQAERSRGLFAEFEKGQALYKRALDIWVSRHFGNARAQEYLTLVGRDFAEEIGSGGAKLPPEYREVITKAADLSKEKRFFHWDLEFPEAFVDLERKTWRAKDEQGFDAMIGNPPYLGIRTGSHDVAFVRYAQRTFQTTKGNWDIFELFLEHFLTQLTGKPNIGMIVPSRVSTNRDFAPLRELFYAHNGPSQVLECGAAFEDPSVVAAIIMHQAHQQANHIIVGSLNSSGVIDARQLPRRLLLALPDRPFTSPLEYRQLEVFDRLATSSKRLKDYVSITRGMECGKNDGAVHRLASPGLVPIISGEGVSTFRMKEQGMFIQLGLQPRSRYKDPGLFIKVPKLLIRFVARNPIVAVDELGYAAFNTVYIAHSTNGNDEICYALASVLNSRLVRWWFMSAYNSDESLFPHIQKYQLDEIPMPVLNEHPGICQKLIQLCKRAAGISDVYDVQELDSLVTEAYGLTEDSLECLPEASRKVEK